MNTGGPAFPVWMPEYKDNGTYHEGLSIRDWFAGQAFAAIYPQWRGGDVKVVAKEAVAAADALIAEPGKPHASV